MDWSVIASASAWYLALAAFGAAGLVPAVVLFERLASRGVFFARPLGLALAALVTWLVVRLTPVEYGTPAVIASLAALVVASAGLAWWHREVLPALRSRWRALLTVEALTLAGFALVLGARVLAPDAWGTEKPADLMLLTAVHVAHEFPPPDPWLGGEPLSYYHLGFVQMDHVGRLAGEPPERVFNLATATVGGLAIAAIAGLAADLVRLGGPQRRRVVIGAGAAAVAALVLVSPVVGVIQLLAGNGFGGEAAWGWLNVRGVPTEPEAETFVPGEFWWWWPTTRVLPGVISEYPGFSLILGDPHPHVLALPLGIVALALGVQTFEGSTPLGWRRWLLRPDLLLLTAALFAALVMTNAWDVITYGAVWGLAAWWSATRAGWPVVLAGFIAARWAMVPAVLGVAIAWPFLGTLDPQPLGLSVVSGEYSDPGRWVLVWGPLLVIAGLGVGAAWRPGRRRLLDAATYAVIPVGLWVAWLLALARPSEVADRAWGWVTILGLLGGVSWAGATLAAEPLGRRGQAAGLFLVLVALGTLLLTELVHIDDAFAGRLNTAFKFWFHAWVLLAAGGGALVALGAGHLVEAARRIRRPGDPTEAGEVRSSRRAPALLRVAAVALGAAGIVLTVATMLTPPAMAVARSREGHDHGLSAIGYLGRVDPDFLAAVEWGRRELDPREALVAEAVTESYELGNRFSAFTGVPAILGWPGHQRQWRSDLNEGARRAAVDAIYAGNRLQALEAVVRWRVTHVIVSREERTQYGARVASSFAGWPIVFANAGVTVYLTPYNPAVLEAYFEDPVTGEPR